MYQKAVAVVVLGMSVQSLKNKAREISYALVRVSFYVKREDLRLRIEKLAFELLENISRVSVNISSNNLNEGLSIISALDGLVRLGHSIYEIEPVNATILIRELDTLNTAMRKFGNLPADGEQLPDLESFFSSEEKTKKESRAEDKQGGDIRTPKNNSVKGFSKINLQDFSLDKNSEESDELIAVPISSNDGDPINATFGSHHTGSREVGQLGDENRHGRGGSVINAAIRQSAIISKVKSGNGDGIKLKEITSEFPDVSERTLRYDLQRLCSQGVIERVGNGGPASHYKYSK